MQWFRNQFPAVVILLCVVGAMIGMLFLQILTQQDLYLSRKVFLGLDYNDFYQATVALRSGASPYIVKRYVTPPVPAYFNIPLTLMPFEQARYFVSFGMLAAMSGAFFLMQKSQKLARGGEGWALFAVGFIVIGFSYPFYFLFDRGNIDAFVLLFMCLSFALLGRHKNFWSGMFLALAIGFKVYPILLLMPALLTRRWNLIGWTISGLALLFLTMQPTLWNEFLTERIETRTTTFFTIDQNSSIAATFSYFGILLQNRGASPDIFDKMQGISSIVYALLFLFAAVFDFIRHRFQKVEGENYIAYAALYFPFMIAVPKLAYHYSLVILIALIPVLCFLWQKAQTRAPRILILIFSVSLALTQLQVAAIVQLFQEPMLDALCGIGLLILLLTVPLYKFTEMRRAIHESKLERTAIR